MFGNILKITFFEAELSIKVISFCMQDQPRVEIRIQDHLWTHFDATNPMAVSELTNEILLKITFFEVSLIVSIYVNIIT